MNFRSFFLKTISSRLPLLALLALLLPGCANWQGLRNFNRDFNYFQHGLDSLSRIEFTPLTIQPNDILSISVTSSTLNQEQVAIFALTNAGGMTQQTGAGAQLMGAAVFGYLVYPDGTINFPLLGKVKVTGMTRDDLAWYIQQQLATRDLVREPNVLVRFTNLRVNVLGEVKAPGTKTFTQDRISVFDALAAAGDLTDRGRRDRVMVIRDDNGTVKTFPLNLTNAGIINGPGFQLRQNDIVYVAANDLKLRETNFNPRTLRDLQIVTSIGSLVAVLFNLVFIASQ
ncbi:MAG: polysaccharide biosynthesis/export family protein [Bacteroidota bacterium]